MSHFKHLVLEDRITIQSDLHDGLSFKKIASHINHDCTTVSSEIRNHLTVVDDMWPTNRKHNRCIHYVDCKKRHICNFCQSTKNTLCKYCNQVACSKSCPDYKEEVCDRLRKLLMYVMAVTQCVDVLFKKSSMMPRKLSLIMNALLAILVQG